MTPGYFTNKKKLKIHKWVMEEIVKIYAVTF